MDDSGAAMGGGAGTDGDCVGADGDSIDDRAVELIPPRYWWLKRLSIAAGCLVVGLVVLRLWWGWAAERRFQDQIAGYRAAGQLVYADEIDAALAQIPDEENAALLYERAAEKMVTTTASGVPIDQILDELISKKANPTAAADLIEANAETLALIHQARSLRSARWPCGLSDMANNRCFPSYSAQRNLRRLLSIATRYYAEVGAHRYAIEVTLDSWSHADTVAANRPLIGRLVSMACRQMVVSDVEAIAPRLRVTDERSVAPGVGALARRAEVFELIAVLLDDAALHTSLADTAISERASTITWLRGLLFSVKTGRMGVVSRSPIDWLEDVAGAPILTLEAARMSENVSLWGRVLSHATWPAGLAVVAETEATPSLLLLLSRPLTETVGGSGFDVYRRAGLLCFRSLAFHRLAATALAIRLYEIDHGDRPARLEALVPDYLPSVPRDPFAEDGDPIRLASGKDGDVLYSVYVNGRDDGGVEFARESSAFRDKLDIVFYLDGPPIPQDEEGDSDTASTEAGEDDEDVDDGSGEGDEDEPGEREPE